VYVAGWRNGRVQKLTPDGGHPAGFGEPGDGEGRFHVAESSGHRIQVYRRK
jgi:hypothetical protein